MSDSTSAFAVKAPRWSAIRLPQPVWLILVALAIGLAGGLNYTQLVHLFGESYGRSLGDFTLILLPSFVLAACFARQSLHGASGLAAAVAPLTAAGMVCPDTGYATLSSIAGRRRLSVALGSFAGFRLLFPAGPLIIATGLGVDGHAVILLGIALLVPVWGVGELWARYRAPRSAAQPASEQVEARSSLSWHGVGVFAPLLVLTGLLVAGATGIFVAYPVLDFFSRPKGALLVAAALALIGTPPEARRDCIDAAMRRTGWLLIVIGAASAFGGMISHFIPLREVLPAATTTIGVLLTLFVMTMIVKLLYGSAMATFATAAALLQPIVEASGVPPVAAVFAICLGSFAILPTDSFYWLVRSDALPEQSEKSAMVTLAGGAALQAAVGFSSLLLLHAGGVV
jgi:GntP family gluconate:H+ symporter